MRRHSADSDKDDEEEKEKKLQWQKRSRVKWTQEGMKGPMGVGAENPYVASTPTYSRANNGAFTLKRRVVILYSAAAAPFITIKANHQFFSRSYYTYFLPSSYLSRHYL